MNGRVILQIVPRLDTGGAELSAIDVARALVKAGYSALVASEGGRMESQLAHAGGELIRLPVSSKNPFTMYSNADAFEQIIRTRSVSVIHARSRAPAWSALIAARRTGIPFVTTYHGIYNARGPLKRYYNSVMARGDVVIANSEWTAEHVRKTYGSIAKRLVVVPRGLDLSYYDPAAVAPERVSAIRKEWGLAGSERVVFLPGRLARWKGHLAFVSALGLLKRGGRLPADMRAVIAGDTQGRSAYSLEVKAAIGVNALSGTAILAPHISDMAAAYLASNIVVSASTEPEAFGRVPPEASAMGRPVIATDHGGARETVIAGETGLLVPPGDVAALAHALADLLTRRPDRLAAMGAKGRDHVRAHYDVQRMCADILAIYRELIPRTPLEGGSNSR